MTETSRLSPRTGSQIVNARSLKSIIDSAIERRSGMSINLAESTISVSLDTRGDWTISIGLSLSSDRFRAMSSGLEGLGFFQATENDGTSYFLWTSLLTHTRDVRTSTEQILDMALRILRTTLVSQYIS